MRASKFRSLRAPVAALILLATVATPSAAYMRPGETALVSVNVLGERSVQTDLAAFFWSDVNEDGRFVAFYTNATDIVADDANLEDDTFVRDMKRGSTVLVSRPSSGVPGLGPPLENERSSFSERPAISASGRWVAFTSDHINLVTGDSNLVADVFIHDLKKGSTERISVSTGGDEANGVSDRPSISGNGRYITFRSEASNLVEGDTNDTVDVFVHDRITGETIRASVGSDGQEADDGADLPTIDRTGRFVAFFSSATNLVDNDSNGWGDIFLRDLKTAKTERVSLRTGGSEAAQAAYPDSWGPSVSAGGRYVLFTHASTELVPNKGNFPTIPDSYVYDRRTKRVERVSVSSAGEASEGVNTDSASPTLSDDGRFITFSNGATNFAPRDADALGDYDVFRHDRVTGATELVSADLTGTACPKALGAGPPGVPTISADGTQVVFNSDCSNLTEEQDTLPSGDQQLFIRNLGIPLGVGGADVVSGGSTDGSLCVGDVCVPKVCVTPEVCVPPGGELSSRDSTNELDANLIRGGADIFGASVAYRPQYPDLFVAIELENMPPVLPGVTSPLFYGLRFGAAGTAYEVRASSLGGGTFTLFRCGGPTGTCVRSGELHGGYGTTGMRVVFALPLDEVGLANGGRLAHVEAFSALGSFLTGSVSDLDRIKIGSVSQAR